MMAYVDDALDAGLLHGLAGRRLVHVLVVLPPALPRTSCERAPATALQRTDQWLWARPRTLGKTMSARLGVEIMSTSTSAVSPPPRLLHGLPSSSFFTRYGTTLPDASRMVQRQSKKRAVPEQPPERQAEGRHRPRDEAELVVVALLEPALPGRRCHRVGRHGRCAVTGHVRTGSTRERNAAGGSHHSPFAFLTNSERSAGDRRDRRRKRAGRRWWRWQQPSTRRGARPGGRGAGWVVAGGNDAPILSPTRGKKGKAAEEPARC